MSSLLQARKGTHSATSVASGNRSSNQSPSIAQASASPVNLVGKPSLPTDAATESQKRLTRESTSASVTPCEFSINTESLTFFSKFVFERVHIE
jgi:hypothetical protein